MTAILSSEWITDSLLVTSREMAGLWQRNLGHKRWLMS